MLRSQFLEPEQFKGQHYCTKGDAKGREIMIFLDFFTESARS